ncbi:type IV pilus modification protein PilV [Cellvibrio mixtus]|uniref:type IV pilus modification protein PilV n=1 Tax=Cellvibrio mixtus TaxID=39650 RepID=UPI001362972E|nr:type IV pilus modification protein PilV [Cellvibrio mixtus]
MKTIHQRQKGVGLIEVLVTVLIIATALLTLSALQMRSLQFNHSAYLRSQANILAYDILDRIRINRNRVAEYSLDFATATPGGSNLSSVDIREWRELIGKVLPKGLGKIQCTGAGICAVAIRWTEQNQTGEADEDIATFEYTTRI